MGFSQSSMNPLDPLTCHIINGFNLMTSFIASTGCDGFSDFVLEVSQQTGVPKNYLKQDIEHALQFLDVLNKAAHISGAQRIHIKEKPSTPPIEYMI
jgi:hypothetical protein